MTEESTTGKNGKAAKTPSDRFATSRFGRKLVQRGDDEPIIEVENLAVDFWVNGKWVNAARDINYTVRPGEVLAIVGESGSGKTVTSMSLLSLLPANSRSVGHVRLHGEEILGIPADELHRIRGNRIAVIFQEPMTAFNPVYRVGFQIVEALRTHFAMTPAEAEARAIELLELVEMPDPKKAFGSYPHQLSGGQRQRAMIAMAISCDPDLLIADEPTTALDVTIQAEILALINRLKREKQMAVLFITHDMAVVAQMADRVVVMYRGNKVEEGRKILADANHPLVTLAETMDAGADKAAELASK